MAADPNDGVRYLFRGKIADFGRTRTFVSIIAFIFGMTVGHTIANFANRSETEAIRARSDAIRARSDAISAQIDELRMQVDSLKMKSDAQKK